jgi:hypothetical protein
VIQLACGIPFHVAIKVAFRAEGKDAGVFQFALTQGFLLVNFPTQIFDESRARGNVCARKSAIPMNGRILKTNQRVRLHGNGVQIDTKTAGDSIGGLCIHPLPFK